MEALAKTVRKAAAATQAIGLLVSRRPAVLVGAFFAFLVARNWRVFGMADIYDGYFVKLSIVEHGTTWEGIKHYVRHRVFVPYNQHFIPLWFIIFFGLAYLFDSNPYVLGAVSFGAAACLLVLLYKILAYFFDGTKKGMAYCLLAAILFSGTPFFLEVLAWKWEAGLMVSAASFCFALLIALEDRAGWRWQVAYVGALLASFWTFGTAWTGAWGILVFLLLRYRTVKDSRVITTAAMACLGTVVAVVAGNQRTPVNPAFLLSEFPAFVALVAVNIALALGGALRYLAADYIHLSSVLGLTMIALFGYRYGRMYRRHSLTEKDMLVVALALVYALLILLSLLRLMPAQGLRATSSPINYIFGNRYLFVFSIPLYLAAALGLGDAVLRLGRGVIAMLLVAALALGMVVGLAYSRLDPAITNLHRNQFYTLTPAALQDAAHKQLPLPDVSGDLYFPHITTPLHQAVDMRDHAPNYKVQFIDPASLSAAQCQALRGDKLLVRWLDLYSRNWCRA